MKKFKLITICCLFTSLIVSCNKSNRINRITFTSTSFLNANSVHSDMKKVQRDESEIFTISKKGKIDFNYSLIANGVIKYTSSSSEYLNQYININLNTSCSINWSINDYYLKISSNNETYYYTKDTNNVIWCCHILDNTKTKKDITSKVSNFTNFVVKNIDNNCSIQLLTLFSVTAGISGEEASSTTISFYPDKMMNKDTYDKLGYLSNLYQGNTNGYYLDLEYGSNDKNTVSMSTKGKLKAVDFQSDILTKGDMDVDTFLSYVDNFVSQIEVIYSGRSLNLHNIYDAIIDLDLYLSNQRKDDECQIDAINLNDYTEIK